MWLREKEGELRIENRGPDTVMPPLPRLLSFLMCRSVTEVSRHSSSFHWYLSVQALLKLSTIQTVAMAMEVIFFFPEASDAEIQPQICLSPCTCSLITWSECLGWHMQKFHQKLSLFIPCQREAFWCSSTDSQGRESESVFSYVFFTFSDGRMRLIGTKGKLYGLKKRSRWGDERSWWRVR